MDSPCALGEHKRQWDCFQPSYSHSIVDGGLELMS